MSTIGEVHLKFVHIDNLNRCLDQLTDILCVHRYAVHFMTESCQIVLYHTVD